ncbi:MAG: S9 family peptidase [Chloroflexota bacterium]|nr:S9 family peptidase [Chloroflexota bacterium]
MSDYRWKPEQIIHYPLIDHVHLAPDGKRVLFTVRTAYQTDEASEFRNQVMLASTDGEPVIQLTVGEAASSPRWSPDNRHIAFLRKGTHGKIGLWLMRAAGGEAWPLTGVANDIRNDITTFRWSPDGRRIAFVCVPYDEAQAQRRARRDDVLQWRVDYEFTQLFVVDISEAGAPLALVLQLTHSRASVLTLDWHPDGHQLAFIHRPTPLMDAWPQGRLATIAADGTQAEPFDLGRATNWVPTLAYSPDGQWLACDVSHEGDHWPYASQLMLYPASGGEARPLADVSDEQPDVVGWATDSRAVYVINQHGLGSQLVALPVDGSGAQVLVEDGHHFEIAHVNADGGIAFVMQDFAEMNSVYVTTLTGELVTPQKVAQPTNEDYPQAPLPQVQTVQWQTDDGFAIEGILYLPHDYDQASAQRLPLLLHIHGGPMSVFQRQFAGQPYYYTPAALCERGIAVLRCNPRGSSGYGKRFRFANLRDWGGGDYRDLQQGVDTVLALGIADSDRLGICGWSYGGFMTSWTITQTQRFKAASIGAPVTNPVSFIGTSDIPSFIPNFFGAEAWEDPDFYAAHSPLAQVQHVQTPAIIQHGDADVRVPLEQGLQFYIALQRRGVPVEMYIYPRQGHAINEPRLLADALQRNLDWFTTLLTE